MDVIDHEVEVMRVVDGHDHGIGIGVLVYQGHSWHVVMKVDIGNGTNIDRIPEGADVRNVYVRGSLSSTPACFHAEQTIS